MRLLLAKPGIEALEAPITEQGAAADLIRKLKAQVVGNMLLISRPDYEKLVAFSGMNGDERLSDRAAALLEGAQDG
ncbi:MAG: hypothetical protein ACK47B_27795 [Armatimonadota bacterium]